MGHKLAPIVSSTWSSRNGGFPLCFEIKTGHPQVTCARTLFRINGHLARYRHGRNTHHHVVWVVASDKLASYSTVASWRARDSKRPKQPTVFKIIYISDTPWRAPHYWLTSFISFWVRSDTKELSPYEKTLLHWPQDGVMTIPATDKVVRQDTTTCGAF